MENTNNSLQQFREILGEMGFSRTKVVLGEWGLTDKVFPGNKTKLYIFTEGNFWIKKGGVREFSGNYRTYSSEEIILGLMRVIDKEEVSERI